MWDRMVIGWIIAFVLRQLEKFKETVDWTMVKVDLAVRVRALLPGTWLDDSAVTITDGLVDRFAVILGESAVISNILQLIAAQRWAEAGSALLSLLMGDEEGAKLVKALDAKGSVFA